MKEGLSMKVVDMHCDTISDLLRAADEGRAVGLRQNTCHIDLTEMRKGDYLLQNFAMFVHLERVDDPLQHVLRLIDTYERELAANRDWIAPVYTYADIEKNAAAGKLSAMLTVEEGGCCKGDVAVLRTLYRLGVRMLTLTWNFENELGWPNTVAKLPGYDPSKTYGLKDTGVAFVREMQRLGMIVDVSHLSDDGFYDVARLSKEAGKPFVASHSNARALCGHSRNLTDDMIRTLADCGGVTGINFCGSFLDAETEQSRAKRMVEHMRHIANVGGLDCLGLGTDFDGIGGDLELDRCGKMPLLADEMARQGFHEDEIEAVFSKNVLRLYRDVLA
jgi:membrane dipeptidase